MDNKLILAAMGFVVGILSEIGVGGGSLLIILLTLLADAPQQTAHGINLFYFFPTEAASVIIHLKKGLSTNPPP